MDERLKRLKEVNDTRAAQARDDSRHKSHVESQFRTQETIIKSFQALTEYMGNSVSKTAVINQLKEIGTPDALKVVDSVDSLHKTLKTHKNVDLSPVTKVMGDVLSEIKRVPKDHPKQKDQKFVDYSKQLAILARAIKSVEKAVKDQEIIVEAPVVNVDAPVIKLDAPDLTSIEKAMRRVESAVKGIPVPELKISTLKIENRLDKGNKLLKELVEKPAGGTGGGTPRATPYSDSSGVPVFPTLEDGRIPTAPPSYDCFIAVDSGDANINYIGKTTAGTATSVAAWQIKEVDETSGTQVRYADGDTNFDNIWDNRESLSY